MKQYRSRLPCQCWHVTLKWATTTHFHAPNNSLCNKLFWSEVKWSEVKRVTVKFLRIKVPFTLGWPYTEGTWFYCDYFIWCVSCTVVVLTGFVMCGCVYVWGFVMCVWVCVCVCGLCNVWVCVSVDFVMCGYFGNVYTCIYWVFVLFYLCVFVLISY